MWIINGQTGWLQRQLPGAKTLTEYAIVARDDNNTASSDTFSQTAPKDFNFQRSNDGSTYTTLDGERRVFTIASPASYAYHRLNVSAENASTGCVAELEFITS
jgi:hypothetical protein